MSNANWIAIPSISNISLLILNYCCNQSVSNGHIVSYIWTWSIVLMITRLRGLKVWMKMSILSHIMFNFDQYWIDPSSIKLHKELIPFGVEKQFEEHLQLRMCELDVKPLPFGTRKNSLPISQKNPRFIIIYVYASFTVKTWQIIQFNMFRIPL